MSDRWSTSRIEAFSDGVLAIAITLLVLEISVPEEGFEDLWRGIADQWPSYLAYVTSFITIGAVWFAHHAIFRRLAQADRVVTRLNLVLLMFVSFLPFPTKLLAEAIDTTASSERAAVIFYGLVGLAIAALITALWRYVAGHRDLLEADVSDAEVDALTRQTPNMAFYGAVLLVAIVLPQIAAFGYLVVAVTALFRSRGDYSSSISGAAE